MNWISMILFLLCSLCSDVIAMGEQKEAVLRQQRADPVAQWLSTIHADSEDALQAKMREFYDQYPREITRLLETSVHEIQELQQELSDPDDATLEAVIAQEVAEKQKLAQKKESLERMLANVAAIINGMKIQVPEKLSGEQVVEKVAMQSQKCATDTKRLVALNRQLRGYKGQSVKKTKRIKELMAEIDELKEKNTKAEQALKRKRKAKHKNHQETNNSKKLMTDVAADTAEAALVCAKEAVVVETVASAQPASDDAISSTASRQIRLKIIPPAEEKEVKTMQEGALEATDVKRASLRVSDVSEKEKEDTDDDDDYDSTRE